MEDCLAALFNPDRIVPDGSVRAFFSQGAEDPSYRIPYHHASPNDACHFGIVFDQLGNEFHAPAIYTNWNFMRLQAVKVINTCVGHPEERGWGGYVYIRDYGLKIMFWEEVENDAASSQGSSPRTGPVRGGEDKVAMKCGQSCVIS